jgi:hypothetical protein
LYPEELVIVILMFLKLEWNSRNLLQQIGPADLIVGIIEESLQKNHRKIMLKR